MGVNPQKNIEGTNPPLHSLLFPPLPLELEVGPLNPARESVERCKAPIRVWARTPAKIELGAF